MWGCPAVVAAGRGAAGGGAGGAALGPASAALGPASSSSPPFLLPPWALAAEKNAPMVRCPPLCFPPTTAPVLVANRLTAPGPLGGPACSGPRWCSCAGPDCSPRSLQPETPGATGSPPPCPAPLLPCPAQPKAALSCTLGCPPPAPSCCCCCCCWRSGWCACWCGCWCGAAPLLAPPPARVAAPVVAAGGGGVLRLLCRKLNSCSSSSSSSSSLRVRGTTLAALRDGRGAPASCGQGHGGSWGCWCGAHVVSVRHAAKLQNPSQHHHNTGQHVHTCARERARARTHTVFSAGPTAPSPSSASSSSCEQTSKSLTRRGVVRCRLSDLGPVCESS